MSSDKKKSIAEALREARKNADSKDAASIYTDEFWEEVERNVEEQQKDFDHPDRDLRMSHKTLHKPFTI
jgi:hypothetical protein